MPRLLSIYVKNFQFFPKSAIYDDDAKYRISEFNKHVATLYFIVRTKKASFVPSTFSAKADFSFHGIVEVGGCQLPVSVNTAEMLYKLPEVQSHFANCNDFAEHFMRKWQDPNQPSLTGGQKYAEKAHVDLTKSTPNKLIIECPIKYGLTRENIGETSISPYQVISLANVKFPAPLEILYIGKSNDDTWNRIYNHNKWGLIEEHRTQTDELFVYFIEINKSSIAEDTLRDVRLIARDESELSIQDVTVATEAALINYFIKEKKFNDHHVGSDITKSSTIVDRVKTRGYTDLVVECELDGPFGVLGTNSTGYKSRHFVEFKL